MFVLQIAKHSPETCPVTDPKYKAVTLKWFEKLNELAAKHKMKVIGAWNDHPGHAMYIIYETPSMDAFMQYGMEPECLATLAFNTVRNLHVLSAAEALALLKR